MASDQQTAKLRILMISGGPSSGKSTAALSYARTACAMGGNALVLSPTHALSKIIAGIADAVVGPSRDRMVFALAGALMDATTVYNTIIVNDWDRHSKTQQDDIVSYARRCAESLQTVWLVKICDMTIDPQPVEEDP